MLSSCVILAQHPRQLVFPSPRDLCVLSVSALDCCFSFASNLQLLTLNFQPSPSSKSLPFNSFADPHPLTPVPSILYKNMGRGASPNLSSLSPISHPPYTLPSSVVHKSIICHSYENTGGVGVFFPFWNSPHAFKARTQPCAIIGDAACASAKKASRE